jgi:hypothetical protein
MEEKNMAIVHVHVGKKVHKELKKFCKDRGLLLKGSVDRVIAAGIESLKEKEKAS